MVEKLLKRLSAATNKGEVETIAKLSLEYWLVDTLSDEDYETIQQAVDTALERLTPKTVAETTPPATESQQRRDVCVKCGAALSNYQIMMGVALCVECSRRLKNRGE